MKHFILCFYILAFSAFVAPLPQPNEKPQVHKTVVNNEGKSPQSDPKLPKAPENEQKRVKYHKVDDEGVYKNQYSYPHHYERRPVHQYQHGVHGYNPRSSPAYLGYDPHPVVHRPLKHVIIPEDPVLYSEPLEREPREETIPLVYSDQPPVYPHISEHPYHGHHPLPIYHRQINEYPSYPIHNRHVPRKSVLPIYLYDAPGGSHIRNYFQRILHKIPQRKNIKRKPKIIIEYLNGTVEYVDIPNLDEYAPGIILNEKGEKIVEDKAENISPREEISVAEPSYVIQEKYVNPSNNGPLVISEAQYRENPIKARQENGVVQELIPLKVPTDSKPVIEVDPNGNPNAAIVVEEIVPEELAIPENSPIVVQPVSDSYYYIKKSQYVGRNPLKPVTVKQINNPAEYTDDDYSRPDLRGPSIVRDTSPEDYSKSEINPVANSYADKRKYYVGQRPSRIQYDRREKFNPEAPTDDSYHEDTNPDFVESSGKSSRETVNTDDAPQDISFRRNDYINPEDDPEYAYYIRQYVGRKPYNRRQHISYPNRYRRIPNNIQRNDDNPGEARDASYNNENYPGSDKNFGEPSRHTSIVRENESKNYPNFEEKPEMNTQQYVIRRPAPQSDELITHEIENDQTSSNIEPENDNPEKNTNKPKNINNPSHSGETFSEPTTKTIIDNGQNNEEPVGESYHNKNIRYIRRKPTSEDQEAVDYSPINDSLLDSSENDKETEKVKQNNNDNYLNSEKMIPAENKEDNYSDVQKPEEGPYQTKHIRYIKGNEPANDSTNNDNLSDAGENSKETGTFNPNNNPNYPESGKDSSETIKETPPEKENDDYLDFDKLVEDPNEMKYEKYASGESVNKNGPVDDFHNSDNSPEPGKNSKITGTSNFSAEDNKPDQITSGNNSEVEPYEKPKPSSSDENQMLLQHEDNPKPDNVYLANENSEKPINDSPVDKNKSVSDVDYSEPSIITTKDTTTIDDGGFNPEKPYEDYETSSAVDQSSKTKNEDNQSPTKVIPKDGVAKNPNNDSYYDENSSESSTQSSESSAVEHPTPANTETRVKILPTVKIDSEYTEKQEFSNDITTEVKHTENDKTVSIEDQTKTEKDDEKSSDVSNATKENENAEKPKVVFNTDKQSNPKDDSTDSSTITPTVKQDETTDEQKAYDSPKYKESKGSKDSHQDPLDGVPIHDDQTGFGVDKETTTSTTALTLPKQDDDYPYLENDSLEDNKSSPSEKDQVRKPKVEDNHNTTEVQSDNVNEKKPKGDITNTDRHPDSRTNSNESLATRPTIMDSTIIKDNHPKNEFEEDYDNNTKLSSDSDSDTNEYNHMPTNDKLEFNTTKQPTDESSDTKEWTEVKKTDSKQDDDQIHPKNDAENSSIIMNKQEHDSGRKPEDNFNNKDNNSNSNSDVNTDHDETTIVSPTGKDTDTSTTKYDQTMPDDNNIIKDNFPQQYDDIDSKNENHVNTATETSRNKSESITPQVDESTKQFDIERNTKTGPEEYQKENDFDNTKGGNDVETTVKKPPSKNHDNNSYNPTTTANTIKNETSDRDADTKEEKSTTTSSIADKSYIESEPIEISEVYNNVGINTVETTKKDNSIDPEQNNVGSIETSTTITQTVSSENIYDDQGSVEDQDENETSKNDSSNDSGKYKSNDGIFNDSSEELDDELTAVHREDIDQSNDRTEENDQNQNDSEGQNEVEKNEQGQYEMENNDQDQNEAESEENNDQSQNEVEDEHNDQTQNNVEENKNNPESWTTTIDNTDSTTSTPTTDENTTESATEGYTATDNKNNTDNDDIDKEPDNRENQDDENSTHTVISNSKEIDCNTETNKNSCENQGSSVEIVPLESCHPDTDFYKKLIEEYHRLHFFHMNSSASLIHRDTKSLVYENGTVVDYLTETHWDKENDDKPIKIRTSQVIRQPLKKDEKDC